MRLFVFLTILGISLSQLTSTYDKYTPRSMRSAITRFLPLQDNARLVVEEDAPGKMFMFGSVVPVHTTVEDGQWGVVDGGRVWSLTFASESAYSMNVHFSSFHIPEGAALWLYGRDERAEPQGAYTSINNYEDGTFGNAPIDGSRITIQYFQPDHVTEMPILDIEHVVHGYRKQACLGSGNCNINSLCDVRFGGNFTQQIRAGGMLLNGAGSGYCSGSMINTIGNEGRQYFLTAAHCGASHTSIGFNWRSTLCDTTNCPPISDRIANLVVRQRQTESDFTLVEILEPIPAAYNLYLSGFSASTVPALQMTCIHHPSGDVQKMAYAYKQAVPDRWSGVGPSTHWRVTTWDEQSTTEPGSSGSPLYDQNQLIIGQLHGGSAACTNMGGYDTYGGIYFSWNAGLSQILDPFGTQQLATVGVDLNAVRR